MTIVHPLLCAGPATRTRDHRDTSQPWISEELSIVREGSRGITDRYFPPTVRFRPTTVDCWFERIRRGDHRSPVQFDHEVEGWLADIRDRACRVLRGVKSEEARRGLGGTVEATRGEWPSGRGLVQQRSKVDGR